MARLALLGCGHMGRTVLKGLLKETRASTSFPVTHFTAAVTRASSAQNLETEFAADRDRVRITCKDNVQAAKDADIILLGFPPHDLQNALGAPEIDQATKDKLVISMLAGVTRDSIQERVRQAHVVRVLPSLGARAFTSASIVVEDQPAVPEHLHQLAVSIFEAIGQTFNTPAHLFSEMTALQTVCHALMSISIDVVSDACGAEGIPREQSIAFAGACLQGYAALLSRGEDPSELKKSLSIPRGITTKAILAMEKHGLRNAIINAVADSSAYARLLSSE